MGSLCLVHQAGLAPGVQRSSESSLPAAGCNLEVDVTWKYLNFFLDDDAELGRIEREYGSGQMLTGTAKGILIQVCLHDPGALAETGCRRLPGAANALVVCLHVLCQCVKGLCQSLLATCGEFNCALLLCCPASGAARHCGTAQSCTSTSHR